ncbi:4Fe-4S dicluster domain-containing protein [Desulfitobacterium dichloroeliminans]|uniref:4Fe-4S dicluster domain-containing protein n=1 Tax=Desulfitobacterium dichloroeliminans TaxID=233055 RepID=UPI0002DCFBA7|nr:4Fe-4S dicluster domain-containing protein [Desulfitobacterium dichloroeliminans]
MTLARYGMVINLHKCVGCGACGIACKNENNVDQGMFWAHHIKRTTGVFPNVTYEYVPTLCNHCDNAACVRACPTQAMYKDDKGLTLHDPNKCIGCKSCMQACPYEVINYNAKEPHDYWRNKTSVIDQGTTNGAEVAEKVGEKIPYYNPDRATTYAGIRPKGIVEKCTLCDHRLAKGEIPYCAASCPADARTVGDFDDPTSEVNQLIGKYGYKQLKPNAGTQPRVFYIRDF